MLIEAAPPASTSRISSRPRRSADTSAARCSCPTSQFVRTLVSARLGGGRARRATDPRRPDRRALRDPADQRRRRARPAFLTGERTPRVLPRRAGDRRADRALARIRAVCRSPLVRDFDPRPRRGRGLRRGDPLPLSGEAPRVQLLSLVQLEATPRRPHDRVVPAGARGDGYRFQFVTLAGFHAVCASMFDLARGYAEEGMSAYVGSSSRSSPSRSTVQRDPASAEAGASYFDAVLETITGGDSSTLALRGSTEEAQFEAASDGVRRASRCGRRGPGARRGRRPPPSALELVAALERELGERRHELLRARAERQERISAGELPDFLPATRVDPGGRLARRAGPGRPRRPAGRDHRSRRRPEDGDQRVQLRRADVHGRLRGRELADLGERRRRAAEPHRRDRADDLARGRGKSYELSEEVAVLARPPARLAPRRAERRDRRHARSRRASSTSASTSSATRSGCSSAERGRTSTSRSSRATSRPASGTTLPARAGPPRAERGTIKATVLVETVLAAFEMDEILYELREHSAGLNAGRWDYIFSVIKKFRDRDEFVLPDRAQVTMTVPFMRAYTELLVRTCHGRGAHAIGGHGGVHPEPSRPGGERDRARPSPRRQAARVGRRLRRHLGRPPGPRSRREGGVRLRARGRPNQLDRLRDDVECRGGGSPRRGRRRPARSRRRGVRANVSVGVRYLASWLSGVGRGRHRQPDGGRRDRGDLALPGLAVDSPRARRPRRTSTRRWTRSSAQLPDDPVVAEARALFERVALGDELHRVPHARPRTSGSMESTS